MQYIGRTPGPPLDAHVERIWYCSDSPAHARERVLPGGGALDLVINLVEEDIRIYDAEDEASVRARSGALVAGIRTRSFLIDPRQRASVVGVHFRAAGAFPFLGISPAEITDTHVQLDELWGSRGRSLRERLMEAGSASERLLVLERALLDRLRSARNGHPAVREAVKAFRTRGTQLRVADLASSVDLSRRRFIEVFEREVGVTPKLYARLQRFHEVKRRIATLGDPESWATFAVERGYFDQSHMIRDFVEFAGMSPASYLRSRSGETRFDHLVHAYPSHEPARPASARVRSQAAGRKAR